MDILALLLALAAMAIFGWGHRWTRLTNSVALGLIFLTAAWIVQTVDLTGSHLVVSH